jgi:hypothetical protein
VSGAIWKTGPRWDAPGPPDREQSPEVRGELFDYSNRCGMASARKRCGATFGAATDAARPQQLHRLRTIKARSRLLHYALDMRCRDASCTLVGNSRGHLLLGAPLARLASCAGWFELEARE